MGEAGFEPATSCLLDKHSGQAELLAHVDGTGSGAEAPGQKLRDRSSGTRVRTSFSAFRARRPADWTIPERWVGAATPTRQSMNTTCRCAAPFGLRRAKRVSLMPVRVAAVDVHRPAARAPRVLKAVGAAPAPRQRLVAQDERIGHAQVRRRQEEPLALTDVRRVTAAERILRLL